MSKYKKWFGSVMALILAGLILIGSSVVIIDPFFHYHKPIDGLAYSIAKEAYQNPGIVKNFEYDSIISGSSMSENFKTSWFKDLMGLNAVKVPYAGARAKNLNIILDLALKNNADIKKVFCGVDICLFEEDSSQTRNTSPEYLYNESVFDDVNYLLNKEVLREVMYVISHIFQNGKPTSFDDAYSWEPCARFNENYVLTSLKQSHKKSSTLYPDDHFMSNAKANVEENILPLIRDNPDVEFNLFIPPYSIIFWCYRLNANQVNATITELNYVIETLLPYKNVKLFYFPNIEEIVENLYLYKDYIHHNSQVNHYMTQCFHDGSHQLTFENYKAELEKTKNMAMNFDYDLFFGDKIPIKKVENLPRFLQLCNDPNYITVISAKDDVSVNIDKKLSEALYACGLRSDLSSKSRQSYLGILNGGSVVHEESSAGALSYSDNIDGLKIDVLSKGHDVGSLSGIKIDGIEYSCNLPGLNIVVYDKSLKRVVDSVCFDACNDWTAVR